MKKKLIVLVALISSMGPVLSIPAYDDTVVTKSCQTQNQQEQEETSCIEVSYRPENSIFKARSKPSYEMEDQQPPAPSQLISGKTLLTMSALCGLGVAYWKNVHTMLIESIRSHEALSFIKRCWPRLSVIGGLVGLCTFRAIKNRHSITTFMNAVKKKVDNGDDISSSWLKDALPLTREDEKRIIITTFFNSLGQEMPLHVRWALALEPRSPFVRPCQHLGIIELAEMYHEFDKNNPYKKVVKKALDEKIESLERYLYQSM